MSPKVVNLPTGTLHVQVTEHDLPLEDLVGFAARSNNKRGFLFVSKVLGKHWPVRPSAMERCHRLLAHKLAQQLRGNGVFVAMAETATGLGHGVFEAYLEASAVNAPAENANPGADHLFLHTTRYRMAHYATLQFEERHSHATEQILYIPNQPAQAERFANARNLILIDDEVSTGNTFLNLVAAYRKANPKLEHVYWVCITDWLGEERKKAVQDGLDLPLTFVSALSGSYAFTAADHPSLAPAGSANGDGTDKTHLFSGNHGRMGLNHRLDFPFHTLALDISSLGRCLVLGTGEFMHPAYRFARWLERQGVDVRFQSTSRSPILEGGAIAHKKTFSDNYGDGLANYLYNCREEDYTRIFLCKETPNTPDIPWQHPEKITIVDFQNETVSLS